MAATPLHRLRLQPRGATLSPWQADTLFGHLCWQVYFRDGEDGLKDFLAPFRAGTPPFVLSDGFPNDLFPRPLLIPARIVGGDKAVREEAMDRAKKEGKVVWLTRAQFERELRGERVSPDAPDIAPPVRTVLKNQINRLTNTTSGAEADAETGNLYSVDELSFYRVENEKRIAAVVTIYFWAVSPEQAQEVENLFRSLARGGYGKKKSSGYGQFDVLERAEVTMNTPDDANAFVALANFVPAADDPREGFYKTHVKYGKLGEAAILHGAALSPFKFPLMMLTAGSTFYSDRARNYVGRLVAGIHPEDATIVQGAFAPVVPMRLEAV